MPLRLLNSQMIQNFQSRVMLLTALQYSPQLLLEYIIISLARIVNGRYAIVVIPELNTSSQTRVRELSPKAHHLGNIFTIY